MELLYLFLRIGLALILLTSAYTKLKDMYGHEESIRNYEIIKPELVKAVGKLNVAAEFLIGSCILVGLFYQFSIFLSILLLGGYTLAIVINLKRGRTDLSCGCGGIVGENLLSWKLVFRNLAIMAVASLLLIGHTEIGTVDAVIRGEPIQDVYPAYFFIAFCGITVALISFIIGRELVTLRSHFKRLLA
ncbi:MauE/DoxX family redox-associated membrane protein [Guptibacillus algicola]|uniref:MauE/DoxX family redox-associated membrane protein n=1 Tax=Guptibacillus algicola TaxID=225844 RepID=UPI001CD25AB2|nr:MauE/DoxX family redox-associated membrane protein [Alkalihalobacillus algicola]MCA0987067.1 DoxX family membrane protein [Alkalihalobacillus algicola]